MPGPHGGTVLLELEPQRHRHLARVRRTRVAAQSVAGLDQDAILPVVPIVVGAEVLTKETGVVEDVVHLGPEDEHPLLALQREVLGERHIEVGHARTGDIDQAAPSGVAEALQALPHTVVWIRRGRRTARVWNLERGFVDELVAGRAVGAVAGGRRAALAGPYRAGPEAVVLDRLADAG